MELSKEDMLVIATAFQEALREALQPVIKELHDLSSRVWKLNGKLSDLVETSDDQYGRFLRMVRRNSLIGGLYPDRPEVGYCFRWPDGSSRGYPFFSGRG